MKLAAQPYFSRVQQAIQQLPQSITHVLEGKKQSTISALDGVRALACLLVVTFHLSLITTHDIALWNPTKVPPLLNAVAFAGDTGVTLFFVLSGFLLFLPYAKALLFETSWPSPRFFYLRRALRILPVYYVSLFLFIVFYRPQYLQPQHLKEVFLFLTLFMDAFQITYKQINGPFWTLAVEWQFYLLLPILALLIGLFVRHGSFWQRLSVLLLCLLALIGWGIFSRYEGMYLIAHPTETVVLPRKVINAILPFVYGASGNGLHGKFLEDFAVGMLISTGYTIARLQPGDSIFNKVLRWLSPFLLIIGVIWLLAMAAWKLNQSTPHTWMIFDSLAKAYDYYGEIAFAIGYGLCVTAVLFGFQWLKRPFEWSPLRWIGLLSYGLYIWHLRLLENFTEYVVVYLQGWKHLFLYGLYWGALFVLILPCIFVLFLLVERPWIMLGDSLRAKAGKPRSHQN